MTVFFACAINIRDMQESSEQTKLTEQERKRLAQYFDVLIEMHIEYKRKHKGSKNENDILLNLQANGQRNLQHRAEDLVVG